MMANYCTARIGELRDTPNGVRVDFDEHTFDTFESVLDFLHSTYDRFATLVADRNAEGKYHTHLDLSRIGGFGVQLRNRFESLIEVGVGREWWIILPIQPQDAGTFRKTRVAHVPLDYYIDGWHRTEFDAECLIAREECIAIVRRWLDTNSLPAEA